MKRFLEFIKKNISVIILILLVTIGVLYVIEKINSHILTIELNRLNSVVNKYSELITYRIKDLIRLTEEAERRTAEIERLESQLASQLESFQGAVKRIEETSGQIGLGNKILAEYYQRITEYSNSIAEGNSRAIEYNIRIEEIIRSALGGTSTSDTGN